MCLYPRLRKNPKYQKNKKNGGNIPPVTDKRVLWVPIGCGKCYECMKKKSREWQIRLQEEIRTDNTGKFVTLTFSPESLSKLRTLAIEEIGKLERKDAIKKITDNEAARIGVRRFLERWRKKYKKSVKHWLVTELGHNGTERIHLHGIIFTKQEKEEIERIWSYGMIWIGQFVNERTINYIIKYIHKVDLDHKEYVPKVLTSGGIGKNYINRSDSELNKYKENTDETYKFRNGSKSMLPIYYRNKIYTEEIREKLWIEKLDKNIRWVGGEKIDISEGEEEYLKLLEYYQQKNERLGYATSETSWKVEKYMKSRKEMYSSRYTPEIKERKDIGGTPITPDDDQEYTDHRKYTFNENDWLNDVNK